MKAIYAKQLQLNKAIKSLNVSFNWVEVLDYRVRVSKSEKKVDIHPDLEQYALAFPAEVIIKNKLNGKVTKSDPFCFDLIEGFKEANKVAKVTLLNLHN